MNEEAIKYGYELFSKDGYTGSLEEYKSLINTDDEALNYSYDLFTKDGYKGSVEDFKSLVAPTPVAENEVEINPDELKGVKAEVDGESVSTSASTTSSLDSTPEVKPLHPFAQTQFPELYDEYRKLEKEVAGRPVMYQGEELARMQEIEEIFNSQPETKSMKRIADEQITELNKKQDELTTKYVGIAQRTGQPLEEILKSDGLYQDIVKQKKELIEAKSGDEVILEEVAKDTNADNDNLFVKVGKVFGFGAGRDKDAEPVLDLDSKLKEQILLDVQGDEKLRQKIAKGYAELNEKENIISNAKSKVISAEYNRIKAEMQTLLKDTSMEQTEKENRGQELQNQYNELLFAYGVDEATGLLKNNFKKTDESQKYEEIYGNGGFVADTADTISTFLEGVMQTGFKGTVGFTAEVMSGLNNLITGAEDDEYTIFDAFSDTVYSLGNTNLLPSSKSVNTQLVNEEGNFNIYDSDGNVDAGQTYKVGMKAIAQALPFTLAIVNDVKRGKITNAERLFGQLLNPTKNKSITQRIGLIDSAYRHTLADNIAMAEDLGLGRTDGAIFSNTLSLAEGFAEIFMPDTRFFKSSVGDAILGTFKGDLKSAATRKAKQAAVKNFMGNMIKELGEEEFVLATEDLLKFSLVMGHENSEFWDIKRQKELAATSMLLSGALGGANVKRDYKGNLKEVYVNVQNKINEATESLQEEYNNGLHNEEVRVEIKKAIDWANNMNLAMTKAPQNVTAEQIDLLIEKQQLVAEMKNVDDAFKPQYQAKIEALNNKINPTLNEGQGKESTTTDGVVQTESTNKEGTKDATTDAIQTEGEEVVEETTPDTSISEIEKIDLSESLGINRVESIIDNLDKQLKDFGDGTLGMNMPVAVARVALKGMKGAVAGTRLTADLVSAGLNAVMETSWYKNLTKVEKDAFHKKGLMNILGEMETNLRKGSQPTTKANKDFRNKVKEVTGQTDTSKKITISEKRLNKKMMQLAEREGKTGERVGRNEIMEAKKEAIKAINDAIKPLVKKYKDNALYAKAYTRALSAVNQYNGKNIEKVNEAIDKIEAIIEKEGKAKELRKSIKKAKTNVKKTSVPSGIIRSILRYDPSWITEEKDIEKYKEILDKFNNGKNFNLNEAQDFFNDIHDKYFDTIPEKKPREVRPANYNEKSELADNLVALKSVNKSMLTPQEVEMVNNFLRIPLGYYDNLKDTEVRALNRALNKFNQSGIIPAKVLFEHSAKAVGRETAKELSEGLGDKLITLRGNALDAVKRLFGKNKDYTSEEVSEKVRNRMLHHIDNVITNFKGYKLYQHVIHPITSKMTKADNEASQIESQMLDLIAKAKTSVEGGRLKRLIPSIKKGLNIGDFLRYETELSIKAQLFFRHKEYEANKEFSNKTKGVAKVYSVDEHIDSMNNDNLSTNYRNGKKDIDAVNSVYGKFTDSDGNFDINKLEESFTDAEVKLLNFMQATIADMTSQSMFTNTHIRGESLTMLNNYFPRKSAMNNSLDGDSLDMAVQRMTSQVSVKDSSSNERAATKAEPLDFNTFNNFLRYVKGATLENNVLPELKKVNEMNASLIRMGGQSKLLGEVLSETVKNSIEAKKFGSSVKDTKLERAFKIFQKNTFNKLLIDPFRFTVDILTNQGITAFANLYRAGKIKNAIKNVDNNLMKKIAKELGSIHYERIANYHTVLGDSAIDYRQTALGALAKAKYGTTAQTLSGNALELVQKNVLSDFGDMAAIKYYQLVDAIAKPLWATELFENFKKTTGIEINESNYEMIKEKYPKELANALALADKETSNVFNTVSTSEQKLDLQLRESTNFTKMVDSFMKSFSFNENSTLWDSIISLGSMGKKGNMTVEQATRNFFILTTRSISYSFLSQVMLQWVWELAFDGDDDEAEDLEEKALERAIAQHGSLLVLGNYGNIVNMIGNLIFTAGHKIKNAYEGEDFKQYEDGLLYSLSNIGKPSSYAKSLGAAGETISTLVLQPIEIITELGVKYAENGEITEEDLIDAKAAGFTLNLISQMTGISTYRLGKIMDKELKANK